MAVTVTVNNGISVIQLEEVVIGSQLKFAIQFERLISEDPEVFEPIDFTGMTLKAEIKIQPSKEVEPDAEFICTTRPEAGWVDLLLDGVGTGALIEKTYYSSLKVWPIDHPEQGDTLLVISFPMKYKATR